MSAALQSHCQRGHEFTPENTSIAQSGPRKGRKYCRECNRIRGKKFYYADPDRTKSRLQKRKRNYAKPKFDLNVNRAFRRHERQTEKDAKWAALSAQEQWASNLRSFRILHWKKEWERRVARNPRLFDLVGSLPIAARIQALSSICEPRFTVIDSCGDVSLDRGHEGFSFLHGIMPSSSKTPLEELMDKEDEEERERNERISMYARRIAVGHQAKSEFTFEELAHS